MNLFLLQNVDDVSSYFNVRVCKVKSRMCIRLMAIKIDSGPGLWCRAKESLHFPNVVTEESLHKLGVLHSTFC